MMDQLTKFVDAVCRIADALEKDVALKGQYLAKKEAEPDQVPVNTPVGQGVAILERRDELKKKLTALGVEFKPKMATDTLEKLLAEAEAGVTRFNPAAAGVPPPADEPVAPMPAPVFKCAACQDTGKNSAGGACVCQKKEPVAAPAPVAPPPPPAPAADPTDFLGAEPVAPADKKITKEDVRAALVSFAKVKGNPAAREVLQKWGKAVNLDQVAPCDYGVIIVNCK
jgi:hypothetical protein